MTELKKGMIVDIFQKPLTGEDPEGSAELIRCFRKDEGDGIEKWEVRFLSDGFHCTRTVNKENCNAVNI